MKKIRVLLTAGGTGGHIYPLIAVVRRMRETAAQKGADLDARFFGDPGMFRGDLERAGIRIVRIASSKMRRYASLQNVFDAFRFVWGLCQSFWKVYWFMPDVAFSKGGPGALAVILLCRFYRIPIVVHESDAVPGITNQISAKSARIVELGFAAAAEHIRSRGEVHVVGNPVRPELISGDSMETAKTVLNFDPAKPLVLFIGGSQGAEALNNFVLANVEAFLNEFQVLHQVGRANFDAYRREYEFVAARFPEELKKGYQCVPYFEDTLAHALRAADIIVSRAGASALFEIAAVGKPSILIPLATAANDHQRRNAYEYAKTGAALVLAEENLLPSLFLEMVRGLLAESEKRAAMGRAAKSLFVPDADARIAEDILSIAGRRI